MRVLLTESQLKRYILKEFIQETLDGENDYNPIADGNVEHNPYAKQIKQNMLLLSSFLKNNCTIMTNIDNGKDYMVYEVAAFANILGKRFCICQLLKDGKPFGSIYTKPFTLFRLKTR